MKKNYDLIPCGDGRGGKIESSSNLQITKRERIVQEIPLPKTKLGRWWRKFIDSISAYPTPRYVEITES